MKVISRKVAEKPKGWVRVPSGPMIESRSCSVAVARRHIKLAGIAEGTRQPWVEDMGR